LRGDATTEVAVGAHLEGMHAADLGADEQQGSAGAHLSWGGRADAIADRTGVAAGLAGPGDAGGAPGT
jgi:hypothetical protein